MKRIAFAVIFSLAAGQATAADAPCGASAPPGAKLVVLGPVDAATSNGLGISLIMGLDPPQFPAGYIAKLTQPCHRLDFAAGTLTYSLYGRDGTNPERWASTPTQPSEIAYIASLPSPEAALGWYRKYQVDKTTPGQFAMSDMLYLLAIADNDTRKIFRFYSAMPDDAMLSQDMCAALSGELPVIATFTPGSDDTDLANLAAKPKLANSACHAKLN